MILFTVGAFCISCSCGNTKSPQPDGKPALSQADNYDPFVVDGRLRLTVPFDEMLRMMDESRELSGDKAVSLFDLKARLLSTNARIRLTAAYAIEDRRMYNTNIEPIADDMLKVAMSDPVPQIRSAVIVPLLQVHEFAERALLAALNNGYVKVRRSALRTIEQGHYAGDDPIEILKQARKLDKDPENIAILDRLLANRLTGGKPYQSDADLMKEGERMGEDKSISTELLTSNLRSKTHRIRLLAMYAIWARQWNGGDIRSAIASLQSIATSNAEYFELATALKILMGEKSVAEHTLKTALKSRNSEVRHCVVTIVRLGNYVGPDPQSILRSHRQTETDTGINKDIDEILNR